MLLVNRTKSKTALIETALTGESLYFPVRDCSADRQKNQDAISEKLSTFYLFLSISIAIQKGNAVCVMGCPKDNSLGLEGLFNL